MKSILRSLIAIILILSGSSYSQEIDNYNTPARIRAKDTLIPSHEVGFYVDSLPKLVEVADIIVQGRYGRRIGNEPFFGYGTSQDEVEEKFKNEEGIRYPVSGLPMSEYEIIIDNVIKGEKLISDRLILRLIESPNEHELPFLAEDRKGNHLFFFMLNPDMSTVGLFGAIADMKEVGNAYTFRFKPGMGITALNSHNKDEFLSEVIRLAHEPER